MIIGKMQDWFTRFAKKNGWMDKSGVEDVLFLCEEAGEVAREVRRHEMGRHSHSGDEVMTDEEMRIKLAEEIGDVLQVLSVIASRYNITLEEAFEIHKNKVEEAYGNLEGYGNLEENKWIKIDRITYAIKTKENVYDVYKLFLGEQLGFHYYRNVDISDNLENHDSVEKLEIFKKQNFSEKIYFVTWRRFDYKITTFESKKEMEEQLNSIGILIDL
jgi:NTP pyrophosphatase (non-canonical NTP hydrolase)